jgi:hypothetical protein
MSRSLIVLSTLFSLSAIVVIYGYLSKPHLLLECTHYYNQRQHGTLMLRLMSDGHVEWEDWTDRREALNRHTANISDDQLAKIKARLNAIDNKEISKQWGPFNQYIDSSATLQIIVSTTKWKRKLMVINPWPCHVPSCSLFPSKPLPNNVKEVLCEAETLRSQVANEANDPQCVGFADGE